MPHNTMDTSRARWLILLLVACVLGVLLLILLGSTQGGSEAAQTTASTTTGKTAEITWRPSDHDDGITTGKSATAPIIDSITIEKREVCEGEENLVTVTAHDPGGNNAG